MTTNVSPSTKKVDDFLSKISQLSQERLRESQKVQRELDSLRLKPRQNHFQTDQNQSFSDNFDVTQLTFNRSGRPISSSNHNSMPPAMLPRPIAYQYSSFTDENDSRDPFYDITRYEMSEDSEVSAEYSGSRLPKKPNNDKIPKKPLKPVKPVEPKILAIPAKPDLPKRPAFSVPDSFGVIRPVAAGESFESVKVAPHTVKQVTKMPNFAAQRQPEGAQNTQAPVKVASFDDIENRIRSGRKEKACSTKSKSIPTSKVAEQNNNLQQVQSKESLVEPLKPGKPSKPTLKMFESKDSELLRDQIKRLSSAKAKAKDKDENALSSNPGEPETSNFKPMRPVKPEALLAHSKLKTLPAKRPEIEAVPEALQKLKTLKSVKGKDSPKLPIPRKVRATLREDPIKALQGKGIGSKPNSNPETLLPGAHFPTIPSSLDLSAAPKKPDSDFHAQLANIIRSLTDPPVAVLSQAQILSENRTAQKLTYPNKSRARGPKRRLPKLQDSSNSSDLADSKFQSVERFEGGPMGS